jgi:hypothetical protein
MRKSSKTLFTSNFSFNPLFATSNLLSTCVIPFSLVVFYSSRRLEQESGLYFNLKYFEELVLNGNWDEVERYLSGFTRPDDNRYSMKIFFEIRKQKYLEALDK